MKKSDRAILLVLPAIALVVGFYLLVISPKQKEIGNLDDEISGLQARVQSAEDEAAAAEAARKSFARNYAAIVSMGSAVPEDSDQATLIYDFTKVGDESNVRFRSFELADSAPGEDAAAAPSSGSTDPDSSDDSGSSGDTSASDSSTVTVSAPATEMAAATLPLGAKVGSAGLPVMPYKLRFGGSFFDMADFFANLDDTVNVVERGGDPDVRGRLMTLNGFAMVADPVHGFPEVQASMSLNTYVVPADQGLADGATPAGPAPVADSTEVAAAGSSAAVPETAAVTP
jgi:Tfp pilus assembly protein PilO